MKMKQRRSYLVTLMVVLFLSWNVVTYYFLTYNTQPRKGEAMAKDDFVKDAQTRLNFISSEVKRQIATNEALLRDLLYHQKDEQGSVGETNVTGETVYDHI